MASKVVSTRLSETTESRLQRLARRLGKTPSETGAMLIEESLRIQEFAQIEFRNSSVGRQAYFKNSRLAVWQIVLLVEEYKRDLNLVAEHLQKPLSSISAILNYAKAYPEEIEYAISDARAVDYTTIEKLLPQTELMTIPSDIVE